MAIFFPLVFLNGKLGAVKGVGFCRRRLNGGRKTIEKQSINDAEQQQQRRASLGGRQQQGSSPSVYNNEVAR